MPFVIDIINTCGDETMTNFCKSTNSDNLPGGHISMVHMAVCESEPSQSPTVPSSGNCGVHCRARCRTPMSQVTEQSVQFPQDVQSPGFPTSKINKAMY